CFFSGRRRHTIWPRDWSSDVCSSDLGRWLAPVQYPRNVAQLHYGPARVPSRESPEEAIALLQERGYTACEIDFEGKFWMEYPWRSEERRGGKAGTCRARAYRCKQR